MTSCKAITLALLLAVTPASAQIISGWDGKDTLPGNRDNGIVSTVGDGRNASTDQFLDWEHTLGDFADIKTVTEQELAARIRKEEERKNRTLKDGIEVDLPSYVDGNGIDLYLLTEEGITAYMALLAPAFYQQTTPDLVKWIRYYAYNKRENTRKMFERFAKWEPHIENCFEYYNVPREIAVLCLIESACTYTALSKAGALGMWQIMPATGRQFGMTVNATTDERKDPVRSTEVAAKILAYNYRSCGDWTLSIAGYNCGIGRVNSVAQQKKSSEWLELKPSLPKETQQYIPSLLAIHYVWKYREKLGF